MRPRPIIPSCIGTIVWYSWFDVACLQLLTGAGPVQLLYFCFCEKQYNLVRYFDYLGSGTCRTKPLGGPFGRGLTPPCSPLFGSGVRIQPFLQQRLTNQTHLGMHSYEIDATIRDRYLDVDGARDSSRTEHS